LEFSHDCAEPVGELKIQKYEVTLPEKNGVIHMVQQYINFVCTRKPVISL
jgi:hypothetical protein